MDVFPTGDLFWMLILTVPVLVVLLVLCIDCRDTELDTPPIGDYEDKPPTTFRPQTFRVVRRPPSPPWSAIQSQPDLRRCPPYSFSNQSTTLKDEVDNESMPSYENEEPPFIPFIPDDEENDGPGYILVLPDVPITNQRNEDHASSDSIMDQYENMPESQRHSVGEYVNILEPEATILEPCFPVGASDCTSDQESDDDIPDYENVCPGF
ncbi:linker for activation of T-cells family member 1 isoform X2 [Anolis carolinensis]|uniref:linker for activation of T-cells family member 1 isoform X2 n=1 Tax=Anolis carolinensis TaxID=28377 RepID=UPI000462C9A4|nr:PREDICTED: linker for activation of T-cells family member 1 isoform X2 [Anolis carolinensis]|eukprot:XP_008115723.1 PREDICTED: linker for activation of T-cells family member 1 isoform X2 [Anolis carolinensis]